MRARSSSLVISLYSARGLLLGTAIYKIKVIACWCKTNKEGWTQRIKQAHEMIPQVRHSRKNNVQRELRHHHPHLHHPRLPGLLFLWRLAPQSHQHLRSLVNILKKRKMWKSGPQSSMFKGVNKAKVLASASLFGTVCGSTLLK